MKTYLGIEVACNDRIDVKKKGINSFRITIHYPQRPDTAYIDMNTEEMQKFIDHCKEIVK